MGEEFCTKLETSLLVGCFPTPTQVPDSLFKGRLLEHGVSSLRLIPVRSLFGASPLSIEVATQALSKLVAVMVRILTASGIRSG